MPVIKVDSFFLPIRWRLKRAERGLWDIQIPRAGTPAMHIWMFHPLRPTVCNLPFCSESGGLSLLTFSTTESHKCRHNQ